MASGGTSRAVEVYDTSIYMWWINSHQKFIRKLLEDTPYKVRYYGGFALNVALGCKGGLPRTSLDLIKCYQAGTKRVKHDASDIDARILGVLGKENDIVDGMLKRASDNTRASELPKEIQTAALKVSPLPVGDLYVLYQPSHYVEPRCFVVAHKKFYISEGAPHQQIVILGVYEDSKGAWQSQVLSELTPSSEKADAEDPLFTNTDLPTLKLQFTKLQKALLNARRPSQEPRLKKTEARIAAIEAELTKNAAANGSSAAVGKLRSRSRSRSRSNSRGGGRRRGQTRRRGPTPRRGSVKN
jgi:hypothetical protein